jgi:spermidine synthase
MVDLDRETVEICRKHLPAWHQGAFDDPRVELLHRDAREYLANTDERFDVMILDLTDPLEEGPSYLLYTQQFYSLVQSRLGKDGVVALHAESTSWGNQSLCVSITSTLRSAFPSVHIYHTYMPAFGAQWGFALAGGPNLDPLSVTVEEVDRAISERLSKNLKFYDGLAHRGMFALPKNLRLELEKGAKIVTDEDPAFLFH